MSLVSSCAQIIAMSCHILLLDDLQVHQLARNIRLDPTCTQLILREFRYRR